LPPGPDILLFFIGVGSMARDFAKKFYFNYYFNAHYKYYIHYLNYFYFVRFVRFTYVNMILRKFMHTRK